MYQYDLFNPVYQHTRQINFVCCVSDPMKNIKIVDNSKSYIYIKRNIFLEICTFRLTKHHIIYNRHVTWISHAT